ncbi:hypothetical protein [Nonomuraea candida]|uniref:hypothetical protein n=1 Tax=Nonomuraea candida TaxID=359159 RepID=UPI0012FA9E69|nr:hypothetical protein [Nonomuraea candida]
MEDHGRQTSRWPANPVPGAPSWEPPPAFTAAAAGMPVWPAPVTDPHPMPPWPAATGELEAEPDEPSLPPPFDPNATASEGFTGPGAQDATRPAGQGPVRPEAQGAVRPEAQGAVRPPSPRPGAPDQQDAYPTDPTETGRPGAEGGQSGAPLAIPVAAADQDEAESYTHEDITRPALPQPGNHPAHYFDPEAAKRGAATPAATPAGTPAGTAGAGPTTTPAGPAAPATTPTGPADSPTAGPATAPTAHPTDPAAGPTGHPAEPATGPAGQPNGPKDSKEDKDLRGVRASEGPANPADPTDPDGPPTDPAGRPPVNPSTRPPEPGDVPVWPPTPATGDKLPELPFSRDTWGQRPSTSLNLPAQQQKGAPAFPAGAFKQPPFQTQPPPPPPPPKSKRALLVTVGALALAGVATGGFFAFQAVSAPTPTAAAGITTSPTPAASSTPAATPSTDASGTAAGTSVLDSEATDPQKLSLSEAFPKKKVSAAGTTFTRVKADMETTCEKAATGAFADALKEQKCSRVLRATYVDGKRRYAVTTGIAVLPDNNAAATADGAKDLGRNVWFRGLPGAAGSGGERVHIAGGYAAGLVWGRYIVFSYATHADGRTPKPDDKTLPKVSGAFRDELSLVLERRATKG